MHIQLNSCVNSIPPCCGSIFRVLQCLYPKKDFQTLGCIGGNLGWGWVPNYTLSVYLPALAFSGAQLPHWHFGLEGERSEVPGPFWALLHQLIAHGNLLQVALAQQPRPGPAAPKL